MQNYNFRYFLIIIYTFTILLISRCANEPEAVVDPAFIIDGIVLDSASRQPIQGVSVNFRPLHISDSVYFAGDSVMNTNATYNQTNSSGRFHIVTYDGISR